MSSASYRSSTELNFHMVGRDGVEPPESKTADLQSAPLPLTVYLPRYLLRCVATLIGTEVTPSYFLYICKAHENRTADLVSLHYPHPTLLMPKDDVNFLSAGSLVSPAFIFYIVASDGTGGSGGDRTRDVSNVTVFKTVASQPAAPHFHILFKMCNIIFLNNSTCSIIISPCGN